MTKRRMKSLLGATAIAFALAVPAASAADDYVNPDQPQVEGTGQSRPPAGAVRSGGETRGSLPITGGDVAGLTAIGAAAVGVGAVLVRRSRRVHA